MKYLLMMMTDEVAERALSPEDVDRIVARHMVVGGELRAAGKWVDGARLAFGTDAVTVRRCGDDAIVVDGPFAETKEVLGGFYLIEAASTAEAIAWARKLPLRDVGAIEVPPAATGAMWHGRLDGARKFMLMIVVDEARQASEPMDAVLRAIDHHYELSLELAAEHKFVCSRGLTPSAGAVTLRAPRGEPAVSDGPFAETKEIVGGYFIIACDDREEAIAWAKRLLYTHDAIEVRPLWEAR
jgi:hypothetical protein